MNKKICLTSLIAMGFLCPAIATSNTGEFPSNGLMQEDYTYTNAATSTNMDGVYEGEVNANAQYENIVYQIARGKYLPANSDTPVDCDQNGYYCAGDSNGVNYSESGSQGLTQCPTGYNNSNTGASADTDCYRTCTNSDVAHSTGTMNGGYYYGNNNQCEPTDCVNGWHLQSFNLSTEIGDTAGINSAHVDNTGTFKETNINQGPGNNGRAYYGIPSNSKNMWAVDYGDKGIVTGQARCSTQAGRNGNYANGVYDYNGDWSNTTTFASLTDETGQEGAQYCYCNVTGYTPVGGTLQNLSSSWVFEGDLWSSCASSCADNCGVTMRRMYSSSLPYTYVLFGTVTGGGLATCEANTITINWNGTTPEAISANNAGTATYGGDVRTPQSATPVPGKRFTGWRFSAPTPASVDPQGE